MVPNCRQIENTRARSTLVRNVKERARSTTTTVPNFRQIENTRAWSTPARKLADRARELNRKLRLTGRDPLSRKTLHRARVQLDQTVHKLKIPGRGLPSYETQQRVWGTTLPNYRRIENTKPGRGLLSYET